MKLTRTLLGLKELEMPRAILVPNSRPSSEPVEAAFTTGYDEAHLGSTISNPHTPLGEHRPSARPRARSPTGADVEPCPHRGRTPGGRTGP
jgi:hypothetical protein